MPQKRSNQLCKILVILGRRGSGKSFLIKNFLRTARLRFVIYDPLGEYGGFMQADNAHDILDYVEAEESFIYTSDQDADFERFCQIIYEATDYYIVIDEIDLFTQAGNMPQSLRKIVRYGRHKNLGLIVISRRPAAMPREITSQADFILSFTQHEPNDLKYLAEFMTTPNAEALKSLPKYGYKIYDSSTGGLRENMEELEL
jgi:hypothetical protein